MLLDVPGGLPDGQRVGKQALGENDDEAEDAEQAGRGSANRAVRPSPLRFESQAGDLLAATAFERFIDDEVEGLVLRKAGAVKQQENERSKRTISIDGVNM